MSTTQPLIAENNWDMWQTRDPHGGMQRLKQATRGEPTDDEKDRSGMLSQYPEGTIERRQTMLQYLQKHTPVKPRPASTDSDGKPRKRRVLPPTPKERQNWATGSVRNESVLRATHRDPRQLAQAEKELTPKEAPRTINPCSNRPELKCPFFCTDTGVNTHLHCAHCDVLFCGSCLHGAKGLMFTRSQEGTITLRCANCKKHPYTVTNAERPPWVSLVGAGQTDLGADIEPVLGRFERHKQMESMYKDRHFIQSLRIPEDPNVAWRQEKTRTKIMKETNRGQRPGENVPDVFMRLLDHKKFTSTHKHRFTENGQGRGIEGRRDDDLYQRAIAGQVQITRQEEPEMDSPHKPLMSWEVKRMDHQAFYTRRVSKNFKSDDAYSDPVMLNGTLGRLASETARTKIRPENDIDARERVLRSSFCVPPTVK